MGEKSFIPKVLQKEAEIEVMLNSTKEEAERIISSAKHDALQYVREFEKKVPDIVRERYETKIKRVRDEAQHIKEAGRVQAQSLKKRAMERLNIAVEEIVRVVCPVPLADEEDNYDNEDE